MSQIYLLYLLLFVASFAYTIILKNSGLFFAILFFTTTLALTSIFHDGGKKEIAINVKLYEFWLKVLLFIFLGCAIGK